MHNFITTTLVFPVVVRPPAEVGLPNFFMTQEVDLSTFERSQHEV